MFLTRKGIEFYFLRGLSRKRTKYLNINLSIFKDTAFWRSCKVPIILELASNSGSETDSETEI